MLHAQHLTRTLPQGRIFEDVSFKLEEGETLVVRGPSGSGKSSLLRCLAWLDPIDNGSLTLAGRAPTLWGATAWRTEVCYVPQMPPPLVGTAAEFAHRIAMLDAQRGRAGESAQRLGSHWGLEGSVWARPFAELSGGEQQRVMLAIAVSRKPKVLLLDEPTSAVDADAVKNIEASLQKLSKVWVTHDNAQANRVANAHLTLERPATQTSG